MTGGTAIWKPPASPTTPATSEFVLTAKDRCDVQDCGARAYWRFLMPVSLHDLVMCGHHGQQYEAIMRANLDALVIIDERAQLEVKLDASA